MKGHPFTIEDHYRRARECYEHAAWLTVRGKRKEAETYWQMHEVHLAWAKRLRMLELKG